MKSVERFNDQVGIALLGFNNEAVPYCQGFSDAGANEYAMDYARMLRSRAKGLEPTAFPAHSFEPNRNVIKATLDRMYRKYFAIASVASKLP